MIKKLPLIFTVALTIAFSFITGCQKKQPPNPYQQIAAYKKQLKQNPKDVDAHIGLGRTYVLLEKLSSALREFETAVALDSAHFDAHHELGITLRKLNRYDEATDALQTAITLNPTSAQAHNSLGLALYRMGKTEDALHTFREALRCDPQCAEAHYNLGAMYREMSDYEKASYHWQKYNDLQQSGR